MPAIYGHLKIADVHGSNGYTMVQTWNSYYGSNGYTMVQTWNAYYGGSNVMHDVSIVHVPQ